MYKIGDFSKISRVSVKTLRYYADIGLLPPAQVDPFTGYRYYALDQLTRLNRILVLKGLGFSLEEIGMLLAAEVSAAQLREMLEARRREMKDRIEGEQARLEGLEARLNMLTGENLMATLDVNLKTVEPMLVLAIRETLPNYGAVGRLYGELMAHLQAQGANLVGPPLLMIHDEEFRESDVDVEAAFPVGAQLTGNQRIECKTLPGGQFASVIYQGAYEECGPAYQALVDWIQANGYTISGSNREIYLKGPESGGPPSEYVTEVQFPVEKAE
jgi:effector-binding domain-containing protein